MRLRIVQTQAQTWLPRRVDNNSPVLRSPINSTDNFATFTGRSTSRSPFLVLEVVVYFAAPCFLIDDDSANWTRANTHRGQRLSLFTGLERPPCFPRQRSGVAPLPPARFCVLPVSKINHRVMSNLSAPNNFVHRRGERNGEPQSEPRLSCVVHSAPMGVVLMEVSASAVPRRLNETTRRLLVFDSFSVAL
jgi:hypothetical protein